MSRRVTFFLSDEDEARIDELTLAGVLGGLIARGEYGEVLLDEHGMEIRQLDVTDEDTPGALHDREQLHAKALERLRNSFGPDRMFILCVSTGDGVDFCMGGEMEEKAGNGFILASLATIGRMCDELGLLGNV